VSEMDRRNVLIVGGGPTGLTVACDLRSCGIAVTIVDRCAGSTSCRVPTRQIRVGGIIRSKISVTLRLL
jgi:2-polyprenyl-6-methoxyphenol hydroxylase-like FAD-dependent oxidoreductase